VSITDILQEVVFVSITDILQEVVSVSRLDILPYYLRIKRYNNQKKDGCHCSGFN
jgi:hypothetical protein